MGRGTAHVLALEALDEMGISPVAIAGAFMGDIISVAYAVGIEGGAAVTPAVHRFGARVWGGDSRRSVGGAGRGCAADRPLR